jgi:hypothetical protein
MKIIKHNLYTYLFFELLIVIYFDIFLFFYFQLFLYLVNLDRVEWRNIHHPKLKNPNFAIYFIKLGQFVKTKYVEGPKWFLNHLETK